MCSGAKTSMEGLMENGQFPDIYADSINVAGGPFGLALTFLLSDPGAQGDLAAARTVVRVRLSPELARVLAETLAQAVRRPETGEVAAAS
jgi:hypothetical protein